MTTASPTPEQLAEWRRLADAATKGPWKSAWDTPPSTVPTIYVDDEQQSMVVSVCEYNGELLAGCTRENAAFIAAARTAVPALLDERERLAVEVENLRSGPMTWNQPIGPSMLANLYRPATEATKSIVWTAAQFGLLLDECSRLASRLAAKIERLRAALETCRLRAGYVRHHCKDMSEARLEGDIIEAAAVAALESK